MEEREARAVHAIAADIRVATNPRFMLDKNLIFADWSTGVDFYGESVSYLGLDPPFFLFSANTD